jgi:DNA processing protein
LKIKNHHRALLGLLLVPELGNRRIKQLLKTQQAEDAGEIFNLHASDLEKLYGFGAQISRNLMEFEGWDQVDKILHQTEQTGAELISYTHECYPALLMHIYDPPILLWVKGDKSVLKVPGIAVIGTRQPGRYGLEQTEAWTEKLVGNGLCINSGLAYGVDAMAHRTALNNGGKTVAVLGSGIDVIYPAKNSALANGMIEKGGAVITEFPPGTKPDAVNFPERNRIVSGMSHGVLVVESGIKGGSMITARSALDQNREVFVIPHQLGYKKGEGCNYLIRTGQGKLVQSIPDILDEISVETSRMNGNTKTEKISVWTEMELSDEEKEICALLSENRVHIDALSEKVSKPAYKLLPVLLNLEIKGAVRQKAGKYFELC